MERESTSARFDIKKVILACDTIIKKIEKYRIKDEQKLLGKKLIEHNNSHWHKFKKRFFAHQDMTEEEMREAFNISYRGSSLFSGNIIYIVRNQYRSQYDDCQELKEFASKCQDEFINLSMEDFELIKTHYDLKKKDNKSDIPEKEEVFKFRKHLEI